MLSRASVLLSLPALALLGALSGMACSSSGTGGTGGAGGHSGPPGGSVEGPADTHCGAKSQVTSEAACHPAPGTGGNSSTSSTSATTGAGGSTGAGGEASEYGVTLENAQGDDDDCKYHIAWTATDIYQNTDVTFTVVATTKTDSKPVTAGEVDAEAFLNDTHPAPNPDKPTTVTEAPAGTYTIGPIRFDKAGKWTVRFHIHEECSDLTEDSPHGHVAFYVNVP